MLRRWQQRLWDHHRPFPRGASPAEPGTPSTGEGGCRRGVMILASSLSGGCGKRRARAVHPCREWGHRSWLMGKHLGSGSSSSLKLPKAQVYWHSFGVESRLRTYSVLRFPPISFRISFHASSAAPAGSATASCLSEASSSAVAGG